MKIAIYYPWLYLTSGVERTILEIIKRSNHSYTIFTNHYDKNHTYPNFKNIKVVQLRRIPVERDIFSVVKAAATIAFQKINLSGYDVLFVHSDGLGDLVLTRNRRVPVVCFCHTPLRPVFDKYYRKWVLKRYKGLDRIFYDFYSEAFKKIDKKLWRNYQYVFFNSNETFSRAKNGGLLEDFKGKCEILHPGIDWRDIKPTGIYNHYFLNTGRIMWTKNIELSIFSFIKFKEKFKDLDEFSLVIAGQVDKKSKSYLKKLKEIVGKRRDIRFIISPSEEILKKLYSECWATISTSFNEDWGLTLLEGNAYGKPALAVNRGGPRESQINGKTGFLVRPTVEEFVKKISKLAGDESMVLKLGRNAYKNVKKYDIDKFVNRIDEVLKIFA